jgi:hypothetical protein
MFCERRGESTATKAVKSAANAENSKKGFIAPGKSLTTQA